MADATPFEWSCAELEHATDLDRLAARGTLRLALRDAGLDARTATAAEMDAVIRRLLPKELRARGVADEASVCEALAAGLAAAGLADTPPADSPEAIFRRLAGR